MIIRSSHTTTPPGTTSDKFARCQWQVPQQEQTTNTWVIKKHGCSGGIMPNSYRCLSHLGDAQCIPFQWACRWISWYRKFWGWIGRRFGIGFPWSGRCASTSCALSWFAQSHSITQVKYVQKGPKAGKGVTCISILRSSSTVLWVSSDSCFCSVLIPWFKLTLNFLLLYSKFSAKLCPATAPGILPLGSTNNTPDFTSTPNAPSNDSLFKFVIVCRSS